MKTLLFFSGQSSLSHIFRRIFITQTTNVEIIDYLDFLPSYFHSLYDKSGKLPRFIEKRIHDEYFDRIQLKYSEIINTKQPDLIFCYNDQMLNVETLNNLKKPVKFGMYLADSPLFLQKRAHIIGLLRRADVIFAPDTYWLEQCRILGAKKTEYLLPGFNEKHHFQFVTTEEQRKKYGTDIFFMGSPYHDNWGYKRALFLSKFCGFRFQFCGAGSWERWFADFPMLREKFVPNKGYLPDEVLNIMINCAKIVPVDANPGIINGMHVRVFDTLASGALPIVEYRRDIVDNPDFTGLPLIRNYEDIPEITGYYLTHDEERTTLITNLRNNILERYSIAAAADKVISALFKK